MAIYKGTDLADILFGSSLADYFYGYGGDDTMQAPLAMTISRAATAAM
jgi:hypothetical protein